MTPLDWRYIKGIEFSGLYVSLDADISLTTVHALLGFSPRDRAFKARNIHSGALAFDAFGGILSKPFPDDLIE